MANWPGAELSLDPYTLVTPQTAPSLAPVFAGVDALFLSEDELELGHGDRRDALPELMSGRLARIAFKRGEKGGIFLDGSAFLDWRSRADVVVDPTGAGDAFAAGVWAGWLRDETNERALARGVVTASFAIEAWGADGLLAATRGAAETRFREWFA